MPRTRASCLASGRPHWATSSDGTVRAGPRFSIRTAAYHCWLSRVPIVRVGTGSISIRHAGLADLDTAALRWELADRVEGEVRFDAGTRGAYATDASKYRHVPIGVVPPRSVDAGTEAVAANRRHGAPLLSRGRGTNPGWQATNVAVVIDWTKYCHRLLSVGPDARTCVVEPHGLRCSIPVRYCRSTGLFGCPVTIPTT